jgi:hypothetical protein
MKTKLSQAQTDVIWAMQHGRQLRQTVSYGVASTCGLYVNDCEERRVALRTVTALRQRELIHWVTVKGAVYVYRLTDAGRAEVAL